MDEDQILQSIIADPQLTDPSIDVGQLRQTTPTRTELLADVPEFSGLKFDPTQRIRTCSYRGRIFICRCKMFKQKSSNMY